MADNPAQIAANLRASEARREERQTQTAITSGGESVDLASVRKKMRESASVQGDHAARLRVLEDEQVVGADELGLFHRPQPEINTTPVAPLKLFDYYDLTTTTLKLRGFDTGSDKVACIAGVHTVVTGGLDAVITISANTYIYINMKRTDEGGTATLETDSALNDGDDDEERYYLWYIPWDTDHIDAGNIIDLRGMPRWTAGA